MSEMEKNEGELTSVAHLERNRDGARCLSPISMLVLVGLAIGGVGGASGETSKSEKITPKAQLTYVGLRHPPLPKECTQIGGGLLHENEEIAFSEVRCSGTYMFWLEKRVRSDKSGGLAWEVIDAITMPKPMPNESVARFECDVDGRNDPTLFAVGTWKKIGGVEKLTNIRYAVKIDLPSLRFAVISTKRVQCSLEENRD